MKTLQCKYFVLTSFTLLLILSFACGQDQAQPLERPDKATEIIINFTHHIAGLSSYRVEILNNKQLNLGDITQILRDEFVLAVQQPNQLALIHKKGILAPTIVSNGQSIFIYLPGINQYQITEAPASLNQIFNPKNIAGNVLQQTILMSNVLISNNPDELISNGITETAYINEEKIEGLSCHHITFKKWDFDWHIWVVAGDKPLLRRIEVDVDQPPAKAKLSWDFLNWRKEISPNLFDISNPRWAQRVNQFGQNKLIGKLAPNFKLSLLDGGQMELAQHRGNDVVVLYFWGPNCPACRSGMPFINKLAQDYKDRKIAVYAVNETESVENIKNYFNKSGLKIPAAIQKGYGRPEVSMSYGVEGIPQTVIIGKQGYIQNIFVGYNFEIRNLIIKDIEKLLSGQDIAFLSKPEENASGTIDLTCENINFEPSPVQIDNSMTFSCTLKNQGTSNIPPQSYKLGLLLNNRQVYFGPVALEIPAGKSVQFTVDKNDWNLIINKPGSYKYVLMVDPDDFINETSESNNVLSGTLEVEAAGKK